MRTKKTVVVLISGVGGSGKTSFDRMIREELYKEFPEITCESYGFADPIKYIAKAFMGWDGEKDDKGRKLLQGLGKIGREYLPSLWVRHFLEQMAKRSNPFPKNFWIIDDWRFPNEQEELEKNPLLEVFTVRITGRDSSIENLNLRADISELSLADDGKYDIIINNDKDLTQLEERAKDVVQQLREKFIVD